MCFSDPVDAIKSSVSDVKTDTMKRGAFTFLVVLRDRFKNYIRAIGKDSNKKHTKISVQYSSQDNPLSLRFLECSTTLESNVAGDAYKLSCTGAEKERIFFYPSINNVPLGGQDRYQVTTTLCPGKSSCDGNPLLLSLFNFLYIITIRAYQTYKGSGGFTVLSHVKI